MHSSVKCLQTSLILLDKRAKWGYCKHGLFRWRRRHEANEHTVALEVKDVDVPSSLAGKPRERQAHMAPAAASFLLSRVRSLRAA